MMIIVGINLIMHTSRIDKQIASNTNNLFQTLIQGIEIDMKRLHTMLQEDLRSRSDSRWRWCWGQVVNRERTAPNANQPIAEMTSLPLQYTPLINLRNPNRTNPHTFYRQTAPPHLPVVVWNQHTVHVKPIGAIKIELACSLLPSL
jgi:hypothetical protein